MGFPYRFFHFMTETTNTAQLLNGGNGLYTTQGLGGKRMPYKVVKQPSGKFSIFKLDESGKATGKPLGTHPDKASADKQLKALYANEKKSGGIAKKEYSLGDDDRPEVFYPAVGEINATTGEVKEKDYYDDDIMPYSPYGGATSFADLLAQRDAQEMAQVIGGLTSDFGTLAYNISCNPEIEDKVSALSALAAEFQTMLETYSKHEQSEETLGEEIEEHLKTITKQIAGDNQPSPKVEVKEESQELFIWKEGNTYRWLAAYSNNRLDDEGEIISSQSHKEFDEALHNKEWPMPEVYLWHIPYPVGKADYHAYDEGAGFPVAAGHFYPGMEWAAEGILKEQWSGNSHGMPDKWVQYDPNNPKVITRHRTKEITFLPLRAAANKLNFFIINKEKSMSELEKGLPAHKRDEFIKAFGEERVKQIEEALAEKSKEADEAGIQKKETTPEATLTKEDLVSGLEFVLTQVKEVVEKLDTRLEALEKVQVKEADQFDIVAQLKAKSIINAASAARVHGNSALAKDAPIEVESEKDKSPTPVGLLNNIFAANEAWYAKGGGR